ncbi:MAG: hypothetical protein GY788_14005 [bacterium]|nr:hypothetical protein [bacterium]
MNSCGAHVVVPDIRSEHGVAFAKTGDAPQGIVAGFIATRVSKLFSHRSSALAAAMPICQTLINSLIPSAQRATVLPSTGWWEALGALSSNRPSAGQRTCGRMGRHTSSVVPYLVVAPMLMSIRKMHLAADETNSVAAD